MKDRSWMLNPNAIGAARKCISLTQIELGVSLKLSHPEFIEMLSEYADLTDSKELQESLVELMKYYNQRNPEHAKSSQESRRESPTPVFAHEPSIKKYIREAGKTEYNHSHQHNVYQVAVGDTMAVGASGPQMTEYQGKQYPTYNQAGKKFKGLYRGQPRYA